mgnify:CR=1 FL=1
MPRYYFDLRDGDDLSLDEEGLALPSIDRVQDEAARSLADMARDAVRKDLNGAGRRWQSKSVTMTARFYR